MARTKLTDEEQAILKSGLELPLKFEDLKNTIDDTRRHAASKWKIKGRHGEIDLRENFNRLVGWVQKFIAIGDTVVTYDPGHAALPWAALRFVLQV